MRTGCSGLVFHRCSCCILSWSRTVGVYDKCPFQLTWMLLTHFDKCLFVMMTSDEDGMNKQTRLVLHSLRASPHASAPESLMFTLSCCNWAACRSSLLLILLFQQIKSTIGPASLLLILFARYSLHWVPAGHTQSTCDTEKDNWKNKTSHYLYFFRVKKEMNTGTLRLIAAFQTQ